MLSKARMNSNSKLSLGQKLKDTCYFIIEVQAKLSFRGILAAFHQMCE